MKRRRLPSVIEVEPHNASLEDWTLVLKQDCGDRVIRVRVDLSGNPFLAVLIARECRRYLDIQRERFSRYLTEAGGSLHP